MKGKKKLTPANSLKNVKQYIFEEGYLPSMLVFLFVIFTASAKSQSRKITRKNIVFIEYPNFPGAHSTWDDIGYDPKYNQVYIGVTNHIDSVGLYQYDASGNLMQLKGFISDMAHLRSFQWQGKIHSKLIADNNGEMYFSTDGGDSRHVDFMNGPHGYAGGYLMKWDPAKEKLTNLGMGLQYESLKDIDIDLKTGKIYAVTFPQVHFLVFDTKVNNLQDLGRLGGGHVPRVLFTDKWGNCYYVDWRQRLVKYEKSLSKLVFAKESLPAFPGTPGEVIITGITAYAKNKDESVIYLITYGGKILAFHPQKIGIGKVEDLGATFNGNGVKDKWLVYTPNLSLGNNEKLYYFIGGHGRSAIEDTTLFMEFDPRSREQSIIYKFPTTELEEATGSNVKDKEGNLFFAGRKGDEYGISKPFMIKFNPEKEVH
jgi:hypothetical protein